MTRVLTQAALAQYREQGYTFPVPVLEDDEVARLRGKLEAFESAQGHPLQGAQRSKSHLLFKWLDDLMRDGRILDAVEDLIGPDILCWNTIFWIKEAHSQSYVSWHQDLKYWGLDCDDLVTAWVALSPATEQSGCMRVLPGSHRGQMLPHDDIYDEDNMLTRGQEIAVEVDEETAVNMALQPGHMSLHNVRLAHASGPNQSDDRRIGVSLHYMPTRSKQLVGEWDSAALVRGSDRYHHFTATPVPCCDMDPEAVAFHEKASTAVREILFEGAERVRQTL
ncbi:MAG: phytanoyl-CoA dioxygenase [Gammaproteobacteria bacterium]|nr:phytanoyl-CoA dioxygenase family protein [Gammaproteobacteria bacterium]NIV48403.1 phytanoyl-CoA dioxygenase [Gammaproteobacteria bacterium]NIW56034.1 phytanoyl-CoA dioxygenase [Gammaproteobacteria bacterium]NIX05005.1 phytanoyl-CoA dioxygenase [Gammaproteobacteria bacterium]